MKMVRGYLRHRLSKVFLEASASDRDLSAKLYTRTNVSVASGRTSLHLVAN